MSPQDRAAVNSMKAHIRDDDFDHDPWGTSMAFYFSLCDFMWEQSTAVPNVCNYRHGAGTDTDDPRYQEIVAINPSPDACTYMSLLLNRYTDILRRQGKDY